MDWETLGNIIFLRQIKTSTAIEIDSIVEFCMKNLHSLVSDRVVRNWRKKKESNSNFNHWMIKLAKTHKSILFIKFLNLAKNERLSSALREIDNIEVCERPIASRKTMKLSASKNWGQRSFEAGQPNKSKWSFKVSQEFCEHDVLWHVGQIQAEAGKYFFLQATEILKLSNLTFITVAIHVRIIL